MKFQFPATSPKLKIPSPSPRQTKKNKPGNQKRHKKRLKNLDKIHTKNKKFKKKSKMQEPKIKVSKSLANPNTNQVPEQIQSKWKETNRNSKKQKF